MIAPEYWPKIAPERLYHVPAGNFEIDCPHETASLYDARINRRVTGPSGLFARIDPHTPASDWLPAGVEAAFFRVSDHARVILWRELVAEPIRIEYL